MDGKCSISFAIEQLVQQGCPLSPLLYVLALEPLLLKLRDEKTNPILIGVPLVGRVRARVTAFTNDITVFVSRQSDREAMKKAVARYEQEAGAMVNFDKSEDLWLGDWRGGVLLQGPFRWSDGSVCIHGVWYRTGPPTGAKLVGSTDKGRSADGYLASKALILKGQD